jgi:hypothetical protein
MGTVVLACQTLKDELCMAMRETEINYPVFYIEPALHNTPNALQRRIQEELNRMGNASKILLVFGFCGNSLLGIKSSIATLVIPKVDNCISLLLGSGATKKKISKEMETYFLAKGWLGCENNLIKEFEYCVNRYGQAGALRIMKIMVRNCKRLLLIDTGTYPVDSIIAQTREFAAELGMCHEVVSGSPRLLHKLLLGPWDEEFIILEPGQELMLTDMCGASDDLFGLSQLEVRFDK